MEEALHDIPALRRFAGLDAGESRMPDQTTMLNFRHLRRRTNWPRACSRRLSRY